MKKLMIIVATVWLVLGVSYGASAWIYVPGQGDTGWKTYTYTAGPGGFNGTAGFVSSNAVDNWAYSELLLDNLKGPGGTNLSFETGLTGYAFVDDPPQWSDVFTMDSLTAFSYNAYTATNGTYFADLRSYYSSSLNWGVPTSLFSNAYEQPGTTGAILEKGVTLAAGAQFSFDWAFLSSDTAAGDFGLFYLKNANGTTVFGLAQTGTAPAVPLPPSVLLLGSGLLGLLGFGRWGKRRVG